MKFIHYLDNNISRIGVIKNNKIFRTNYNDLEELFDIDLKDIKLLDEETNNIKFLPIIEKPKQDILCLGMNYYKHKNECLNAGFDNDPHANTVYFSKRCNKAITSNDYINLHKDITKEVDYEGELGLILKKDSYKLETDEDIYNSIFGYCIINDVSARDLQKEHQQFLFGKSLDTFTSISEVLVTVDELGIKPELDIKTYVNDELRQDDNTRNMMFNIPYFLKELTKGITLEKGTIIATGTPSGIGKSMSKFLKDKDVVRIEIEKIGTLINKCME